MTICENAITDYLSINVSEDETLWNSGSTYNNGDEARDGHYIYKYAGVDGTNSTLSPSNARDLWEIDRPTNYYAMLSDNSELAENTSIQTQKTDGSDLVIEFTLSNYNTFSLINIIGTSITVEIINTTTNAVIESETIDLINRNERSNAYLHYFSPIEYITSYYKAIQIISGAKLKITVAPADNVVGIGRAVLGFGIYLGETYFSINPTQTSYSTSTVTQFGTSVSTAKPFYNPKYTVRIPAHKINSITRKHKSLAGKPILIIGDETDDSKFENLLTYGLWEKAEPNITNPTQGILNVTIKDLS